MEEDHSDTLAYTNSKEHPLKDYDVDHFDQGARSCPSANAVVVRVIASIRVIQAIIITINEKIFFMLKVASEVARYIYLI